MKVEQTLSSGRTIRQDFRDAARFVMFETDYEGWEYATLGGTLFLVNYGGRVYGITCHHVLQSFTWKQLVITDRKVGSAVSGIKAVYSASNPQDGAVDSDLLDIAILELTEAPGFFNDTAYIIAPGTTAVGVRGDQLWIHGALKDESSIGEGTIRPVFALLEFEDTGGAGFDPALRQASAKFYKPAFQRLTGLSGGPVFNRTRKGLSGIVTRGELAGDLAEAKYVDIGDILRVLAAMTDGTMATHYVKTVG